MPTVIIEIGSQSDPKFLAELANRYRPYIIIDDGSHIAQHIQLTFESLYPSLMPGGYYIIEDTYMHFGVSATAHLGDTPISFGGYFSDLALSKMRQWITGDSAARDFKHYWFRTTESISFAKAIIATRKKPGIMPADQAIAIAERFCETENGNSSDTSFGAAGVILAAGGPLGKAEDLMRRAIAGNAEMPQFYYRLSEILDRQERHEEAIEAMSKAVELAPNDPSYWSKLARLYARVGDDPRACDTVRKSIELHANPHSYRFLSEILRRSGQVDEAANALKQAITLAEGTPLADECKRQLELFAAAVS